MNCNAHGAPAAAVPLPGLAFTHQLLHDSINYHIATLPHCKITTLPRYRYHITFTALPLPPPTKTNGTMANFVAQSILYCRRLLPLFGQPILLFECSCLWTKCHQQFVSASISQTNAMAITLASHALVLKISFLKACFHCGAEYPWQKPDERITLYLHRLKWKFKSLLEMRSEGASEAAGNAHCCTFSDDDPWWTFEQWCLQTPVKLVK